MFLEQRTINQRNDADIGERLGGIGFVRLQVFGALQGFRRKVQVLDYFLKDPLVIQRR